jgi:glutamine synthetase
MRDDRTHIENRLGCGSSNPYLLMAATLAAGLDGIKQRMTPPAPVDGVAYGVDGIPGLPTHLDDALAALEADATLQGALGPEFIQLYTAVKTHEINQAKAAIEDYGSNSFQDRVDEWERSEYFEFL